MDGLRHAGVVSAADLDQLFASVTSARVVAGATFDERHRSHQTTLAVESSSEALAALRLALSIDADSLLEAHAFMTPGEPTIALFGNGHALLATVTYLHPGYLRWRARGADARLADPEALPRWLASRGWISAAT